MIAFFLKLLLVKKMITQMVVYQIIFLSKIIIHYKIIALDLSKQQVLDADPKAKQQVNLLGT